MARPDITALPCVACEGSRVHKATCPTREGVGVTFDGNVWSVRDRDGRMRSVHFGPAAAKREAHRLAAQKVSQRRPHGAPPSV